jgi:hypothetical protein
VTYDLTQDDPLIRFGEQLVTTGLLGERDVLKRIKGEGRDFFAHHDLGNIMGRQDEELKAILDQLLAKLPVGAAGGEPAQDLAPLLAMGAKVPASSMIFAR